MNVIPLSITPSWNQSYGKSSSPATSYGRLTVFPLMFFDMDIPRRTVRANNACADDCRLQYFLQTFLAMSSRLTPAYHNAHIAPRAKASKRAMLAMAAAKP